MKIIFNLFRSFKDFLRFLWYTLNIAQWQQPEWEVILKLLLIEDDEKLCELLLFQLEKEKPDSFSEEDLEFCEEILNKTKDIRMQDILHTIGQLNKQMIEQYNDQYRSLLQLKGATFEQINMEIQENADSILHIWKKK